MQRSIFDSIERWGNRLPHPVFIFVWLSLLVAVLSFAASITELSYNLPGQETQYVQNLLSPKMIRQWLGGSVNAFINFPPLGIIVIVTIGIGLADASGLISYAVQRLVNKTGTWQLTTSILALGIISNVIGSVGYIILIPLACRAYQAAGRPPLAGLATAFAGVAGGTHATIFVTTYDVVISGITTSAAQLIDPEYVVSPLGNYFFMAASVVLLVVVGSIISIFVVEKRQQMMTNARSQREVITVTQTNDKAMWVASGVFISIVTFFVFSAALSNGWLAPFEGQALGRSEVMRGLPVIIASAFGLSGITYGFLSGNFKSENDLIRGCQKSISQLGLFLLIIFVASQLIYLFKLSQLSGVLAVSINELVTHMSLHPALLVIVVVVLSAALNIFMGSPVVQWSVMAPVLIPSLFYVGIPLEVTQAAFRIGDSVTNIVSPLFGYLGLILASAQEYDKNAKIGTLMSLMLPFSIAFLFAWTTFLILWVYVLQLPVGI